jgi:hypothetical protein
MLEMIAFISEELSFLTIMFYESTIANEKYLKKAPLLNSGMWIEEVRETFVSLIGFETPSYKTSFTGIDAMSSPYTLAELLVKVQLVMLG